MERIENNRVVRMDSGIEWGEKDEKISVWYAKPRPNILLAATNASFLKSTLQRIARPATTRSALFDFPEWKYVDTQAPVWGIRHRRTAMPIYILAASSKDGFPFAELSGITFSYQPRPTATVSVQLHYPKEAEGILPRVVAKESHAKLISPSVVESRMTIGKTSNASEWPLGAPWEASFIIHHFMGYTICP